MVVWGRPKSGKTFWVLDLALHIAAGLTYRSRETEKGAVFYCTFEGAFAFPDRVLAAVKGLGIANLDDVPFYMSTDFLPFSKVGGVDDVIREIQLSGVRPRLVVLDTLNMSLDGDENSSQDMRFYTRCVGQISKEFDCTVIVIHHCGTDGTRPRGHTSLTGTCDAQIVVSRRGSRGPGGASMMEAKVEFMKDGPEDVSEFSWLQPYEFPDGGESCYLVEAPAPAPGSKLIAGGAKRALSMLQRLLDETGEETIQISDWRELYVGMAGDAVKKKSSMKAFNRAMTSLIDNGVVFIEGTKVGLMKESEHKTS